MDLVTELNQLFVDRKWCQLLTTLNQNSVPHTDTCLKFILTHLKELIDKVNLPSFMSIISLLTDISSHLSLVEQVIFLLNGIEYKSVEQEECAFIARLNYDILTYKTHSKVYEYFKIKIPDSAKERFYCLVYLYFDHVNDFNMSYKYLSLYLDTLSDKNDVFYKKKKEFLTNKLAEIALKAENVYSFDDILPKLSDSDLKSLVLAYNTGDINYVNNTNHSFPKEKVYLISLVKLCVYKKSITVKEISDFLQINYSDSLFLIFKALGKELIKGYYDGKTNQLYLFKSINKSMNDNDIKEMKIRFGEWRNKVIKQMNKN
ncbi:26S proteasome regulatory subunit RPN9 PSMD13 [Tubulinosema ratisbonensis]|uniref:26S proteasome regulatory subunit RPN9 PSMD13 n=1 Tax=Tubulinosema ratisbonensis TaxID=291195 RepID=A0A437AIN9_9MICR|nr:26S proteasome regulatory subunit RPN9 PSMD13 [Tubulinosema ratisbonensis]